MSQALIGPLADALAAEEETTGPAEGERMLRLLKAMSDLDPSFTPFLGQLMGMFHSSPWPAELSRYVFGPIIVHSARGNHKDPDGSLGWLTRDLRVKYRDRVHTERLEIAMGKRPDLVSPTELWMVLYNAVHDAPLGYVLSSIYCWAVDRSMEAGGFNTAETRAKYRADCVNITDDDIFTDRHPAMSHEYRSLCREIRQKVCSHSDYRVGAPRRMPRWMVQS